MNAKKKNKKAHKPPNSNPPQNIESVSKKEEKVEEIQPKCEVKEDILPIEVPSEVLPVPVSEVKEVESETPKKPKRNKGKNKKNDKEEENIEVQEKPPEVPSESNPVLEETQKIDVKIIEDKEDLLGEASVVPNVRKKKNKKKAQEKIPEEPKPTVDDITIPKIEPIESIENIDPKIQELCSSKPETPKEGKKKKNKKKNRTDSEKSDKSDNVLSCTSAFQKILAEDESSKQEQLQDTLEAKQKITDVKFETDNHKECKSVETLLLPEVQETKEVPEESKDNSKGEIKTKKKNKKDKKHQHKETTDLVKHDVPEETPDLIEIVTKNILTEELEQDKKESAVLLVDSQKHKDTSPKPKAKIVKPVEKKQNEKSTEHLSNIESSEIIKENKKGDELFDKPVPEAKVEEILTVNIAKSKIDDDLIQQLPASPSSMENISVPSDQSMGKKRKKSKSPKPQKNKADANLKTNVETQNLKLEIAETIPLTEIILNLDTETQVPIIDPKETMTSGLSADVPVQMPVTEKEHLVDLTEPKILEKPSTSEMKKDNEGFETKTSKKKKKTFKIPVVEASLEVKEIVVPPEVQTIEENPNLQQHVTEKKVNIPIETLLSPEVEVQSVRTESEASSCDAIPEIHFIRSYSQQLIDTNNNTIIQEVTNVDEMKLSDIQLTPLIQGSGETPVATPELISSGITMTEIESKSPTEEKTDIKSKMMEVNQDMEDLRLSIERSLAEFAALEKCETDSEPKQKTEIFKKEHLSAKNNKRKEKHTEEIKVLPDVKQDISLTIEAKEPENTDTSVTEEASKLVETSPVCPARKDNKGKGKSKKKGKQDCAPITSIATTSSSEPTTSQPQNDDKDEKREKSEQKSETSQEKGKQQSTGTNDDDNTGTSKATDNEKHLIDVDTIPNTTNQIEFEQIENFEDALTSSFDDVNKTFEMIAKDIDDDNIEFQKKLAANKPDISITEPAEDRDKDTNKNEKVNPVSQPKNLLGHTDIPVQSNKTDYKKEKNKTPNARQAKVKIKDSSEIETKKESKESQTVIKRTRKISDNTAKECFSKVKNDNEEYVYKYSFRKVFLQSACHVCNKDLGQVRVPCGYCNLIFYCGMKHKDEDWPQHQALCFAVSTLAHMKDQKHIYADAQNTTGQDYRLLRMQMIVSCEKVLKRRLVPWEQEIMLYPRMCAEVTCREWRQTKLKDCDGCGQISYCATNPNHLPKSHARWCKSYSLYQRLVSYQQTKGRLEPRLPTRVLKEDQMPGKMNEVLAAMYEEKIDINDIQYASLTQLATAPLTTAYCLQLCRSASGITNGIHKKHPFTIHVVGAELQFEADALNKWETFFLHILPDVDELRVVLISPALNPGHLPLNLLGKIRLCDYCQQNKRRLVFKFEDNKNYFEYRTCEDFINPDIICAFNPSIQRSSIYNGKDPWPASINSIFKLKTPFIVTAYTLNELRKDIARIKQVSEIDFKFILEPGFNSFASVRPDRNFISDDEMPLLFKNYCVSVVVGC